MIETFNFSILYRKRALLLKKVRRNEVVFNKSTPLYFRFLQFDALLFSPLKLRKINEYLDSWIAKELISCQPQWRIQPAGRGGGGGGWGGGRRHFFWSNFSGNMLRRLSQSVNKRGGGGGGWDHYFFFGPNSCDFLFLNCFFCCWPVSPPPPRDPHLQRIQPASRGGGGG